MKNNYKLLIAYDGTEFGGWQVQPNAITIQQRLQEAAEIILRHPITLIGSGRTDAGVHAAGQVAHFKTDEEVDVRRFLASMNGLLPPSIRLQSITPAPLDFHAQYSAVAKTYHYHLCLQRVQDPFKRLYAWHLREPIDLQRLQQGASYLLGTHDFTSFANEAHAGSAAKDPVRTLKRIDLVEEEQGIRLEFEADGFLYKMVRNCVGTLVEIARGKRDPQAIERILQARDRRQAGKAARPGAVSVVRRLCRNRFGNRNERRIEEYAAF